MNFSSYTTLTLKLIGIIFIISSFLDYITLAIPLRWQQAQWQIGFVTSVVDRGIVPMVGMGFILVGYWIDQTAGLSTKGSKLDLRLPAYVVASVLGLLFLLMVPLHLNNLNQAQNSALEQIEQGDYGHCIRCGEAIPRGRLEIVPETRLCVTCAARR